MRLATRLLAPLLTLLLTGHALASAGPATPSCVAPPDGSSVPHAANWICSVMKLVTELGFEGWIDGIVWAVLLAAFVARTLMISLDANAGPKLRDFLITSAFAFGLMLTLTPIRDATYTVWRESYIWSHSKGAESSMSALEELVETIDSHTTAEALVAGASTAAFAGTAGAAAVDAAATTTAKGAQAATRVSRIVSATKGAGNLLRNVGILRVVDLVIIPIMSLYAMIIFGGALAVIVGGLVLPIGSIMMVTGNGGGFFSVWSKVQLGAILTMVVFPLMFGVAINVAITQPLGGFLTELQRIETDYQTAVATIPSGEPGFWESLKNPGAVFEQAFGVFSASVGAFFNKALAVAGMITQLIIGAITAIGLIFLLQTLIQRFIAGIGVQGRNLAGTFGLFRGGGQKGGGSKKGGDAESNTATQSEPVRVPARGFAQAARGDDSGGSNNGNPTGGSGPKSANVEPLPHVAPTNAGTLTGPTRT